MTFKQFYNIVYPYMVGFYAAFMVLVLGGFIATIGQGYWNEWNHEVEQSQGVPFGQYHGESPSESPSESGLDAAIPLGQTPTATTYGLQWTAYDTDLQTTKHTAQLQGTVQE